MQLENVMIVDAVLEGFSIVFFAVLQTMTDNIHPAILWAIVASLVFRVIFRSFRSALIGAFLGFSLARLFGLFSSNPIF